LTWQVRLPDGTVFAWPWEQRALAWKESDLRVTTEKYRSIECDHSNNPSYDMPIKHQLLLFENKIGGMRNAPNSWQPVSMCETSTKQRGNNNKRLKAIMFSLNVHSDSAPLE